MIFNQSGDSLIEFFQTVQVPEVEDGYSVTPVPCELPRVCAGGVLPLPLDLDDHYRQFRWGEDHDVKSAHPAAWGRRGRTACRLDVAMDEVASTAEEGPQVIIKEGVRLELCESRRIRYIVGGGSRSEEVHTEEDLLHIATLSLSITFIEVQKVYFFLHLQVIRSMYAVSINICTEMLNPLHGTFAPFAPKQPEINYILRIRFAYKVYGFIVSDI